MSDNAKSRLKNISSQIQSTFDVYKFRQMKQLEDESSKNFKDAAFGSWSRNKETNHT